MRADRGGSAASLSFLSLIEELGVRLDAGLLDLALTHRSYAYEHGQIPNNERLEFLGDSVLGVIVRIPLLQLPDHAEGQLAAARQRGQRGQFGDGRPQAEHRADDQARQG